MNPMKNCTQFRRIMASIAAATAVLGTGALAQPTLVHRYSFNDTAGSTNFVDSVGGPNWAGQLQGNAALDGSMLQLDGLGSFATVPASIVHTYTQVTIEFWASFGPDNPVWTRTFAF